MEFYLAHASLVLVEVIDIALEILRFTVNSVES